MTETSQVVYHAQCPHCATVRKISHAQLQAAKGLVQCRQCDQTYPARGNLLKPDQVKLIVDQPSIAPSATPMPVTITPHPQVMDHDALLPSDTPVQADASASETSVLDDIFERLAADANASAPVASSTSSAAPDIDTAVEEAAPKKVKSSGLFAKLLSRKNQHQAEDVDEADEADIIFESIDMEDGFKNNKAQLHVDADVRPQGVLMEHINSAASDEMVKKYRENKLAANKRPVNDSDSATAAADALLATLQGVGAAASAELPTASPNASSKPLNPLQNADDFVFQMQEDFGLDEEADAKAEVLSSKSHKPSSHQSKLQSLLVREQADERAQAQLTEADVIAPDYDANKEWFTQFFNSLNQNQAMSILGNSDLQADNTTVDENGEPIAAAKRLHDGGSNTVAMRLPENSMLVFTLEDDGTSHSQLSFIDIQEHLPHKAPETTHTTIVQQSHHNEHTIWTVACIVAILVLIIQMFYYFLLLTP